MKSAGKPASKKDGPESGSRDEILGISPGIEKVRELIAQAAASDARILIRGENGTGKELVARAVHRLSDRSGKPFVEVNCAAIPDTLIESELFGHEKGSFTDAYNSRKGRFELASGGTLFLDEIGDMSLTAQSKVLRAIQEQKIERVGGEKSIDVDVRIVAATNQDLEQAVEKGRFRQDLFFRLNVIPIDLPPLRERKIDIPLLLSSFIEQFSSEKIVIGEAGMALLVSYPWPGNIRELRNFAERLAILYPGKTVGETAVANLLKLKTDDSALNAGQAPDGPAPRVSGLQELPDSVIKDLFETGFGQAMENFEKYYLEFHFSRNNGIISDIAEAAGIDPVSLRAKLRKHGIVPDSAKE